MMVFEFFTPIVFIHPEREGNQCCCSLFNIRATCRKFRALVNELPIWFDPNFKLVQVVPYRRGQEPVDDWETYEAGFLRLLLQDLHLVQCLERRTSWHFKNLQSLLAVIDCVPSFPTATRSIVLFYSVCSGHCNEMRDWKKHPINKSLGHLGICQSLTSLMIYGLECCTLDLSMIGKGCPLLKRLQLIFIESCKGMLHGLSLLDELHTNSSWAVTPSNGLIPVDSVTSLTHLALIFGYEDFWLNDAFDDGDFDGFVNLKSLYIHPLSNAVCDFLIRSTIELKELRTTVIKKYGNVIRKVITIFSKPSLRNLCSLCFAMEDHREWRPLYESVIESITTNLTNIEEMVIGMGMDASWWPMFTKLRYLKRLIWFVPEDACESSGVMPDQALETDEDADPDEDADYVEDPDSDEDADYVEDPDSYDEDTDEGEEEEEADCIGKIEYDELMEDFYENMADNYDHRITEKLKSTVFQRHMSLASLQTQMPIVQITIFRGHRYSAVCDCYAVPELYDRYSHNGRLSLYEGGGRRC